jgi:hypothetical protein
MNIFQKKYSNKYSNIAYPNFEIYIFLVFCENQNWSGFAGIAYGVHIDTFVAGLCAEIKWG